MTLKLYVNELSPCVRAVLMSARILGITLELKELDLTKSEQLNPQFLKINPQHTVPTLVDNQFVIWDSHAIMAYLVGKYGKNDDLYPKNMEKRALIDQRLHFESSMICPLIRNILNKIVYENEQVPLKNYIESVENAYNFLNNFLKDTEWITGDTITIADLSLLASVTSLNEIFEISEKYANLLKWIRLSECQVWYAANENGLNQLKSILCKQSIKCNNLIK